MPTEIVLGRTVTVTLTLTTDQIRLLDDFRSYYCEDGKALMDELMAELQRAEQDPLEGECESQCQTDQ